MKCTNIKFWMSLFLIGLVSCTNPQKGNTNNKEIHEQSNDLNTLKKLIGKPLSTLDLSINFQKRDTVFEAEDGTTWPGLIISQNGEVLFWVEASWVDTINVRSLTIVSPQIIISDTLHVNSKFVEIRSFLDDEIPFTPDGYFYLKDKSNDQISYYFDIDGISELSNKQPQFDSIPEDLVIESIVLD